MPAGLCPEKSQLPHSSGGRKRKISRMVDERPDRLTRRQRRAGKTVYNNTLSALLPSTIDIRRISMLLYTLTVLYTRHGTHRPRSSYNHVTDQLRSRYAHEQINVYYIHVYTCIYMYVCHEVERRGWAIRCRSVRPLQHSVSPARFTSSIYSHQ